MTISNLIKVNENAEDNIESKVSLSDLDKRLTEDRSRGFIRSEQWFRNASLWCELAISYNNPYSHKRVHSELYLLHYKRSKLTEIVQNSTFIFYGIGTGETEMELVGWELERKNYAEVIGIDVNDKFIRKFIGGLRNKTKENPNYQIMFKGYHSLFEQLRANNFILGNSMYNKRTHICLGNTIGNHTKQSEIFQLFSANSQYGDLLVLGFQLDTDIDILFRKYSTNPEFAKLVLNWETNPNFSQLDWELDKEDGIIKAKYKGIDVFRSKKYKPQELRNLVSSFRYQLKSEVTDNDRNACIQIYEKL